jgi:hypothetical protein
MDIQRSVVRSELSDSRAKYTVRLISPVCGLHEPESIMLRFELLRMVVDNPDLIACGGSRFEQLKVFYDGDKWVLEVSAVS